MHFLWHTHPNLKLYVDLCTYLFAIPHWTVILPNIGSNLFFLSNLTFMLQLVRHLMHNHTQKISQKRWKVNAGASEKRSEEF